MSDSSPTSRADDELVLDGARLEGADFSGRRLQFLSVSDGSTLVRCGFTRARINGGSLGGGLVPSEYVNCVFDRAHLTNVIPGRARFVGCSFRDVRIRNFKCHEAEFVDCVFSGELRAVIFNGTVRNPDASLGRGSNEFHGNDFSAAKLVDVSFRSGIDLHRQRLPSGPDHLVIEDAPAVLTAVRAEIERWPEQNLREEADIVLMGMEDNCRGGQRDLFVRRSQLGQEPEASERLAALFSNAS